LNLSIRQGDVLVTPLQIARMIAAVGNGGTLYQPQLVLRLQHSGWRRTRVRVQADGAGQLPLQAGQLAAIQERM
jgi:penicillin-binding protein 2